MMVSKKEEEVEEEGGTFPNRLASVTLKRGAKTPGVLSRASV